jgi:hypothetical protein
MFVAVAVPEPELGTMYVYLRTENDNATQATPHLQERHVFTDQDGELYLSTPTGEDRYCDTIEVCTRSSNARFAAGVQMPEKSPVRFGVFEAVHSTCSGARELKRPTDERTIQELWKLRSSGGKVVLMWHNPTAESGLVAQIVADIEAEKSMSGGAS